MKGDFSEELVRWNDEQCFSGRLNRSELLFERPYQKLNCPQSVEDIQRSTDCGKSKSLFFAATFRYNDCDEYEEVRLLTKRALLAAGEESERKQKNEDFLYPGFKSLPWDYSLLLW